MTAEWVQHVARGSGGLHHPSEPHVSFDVALEV